ncbi:MAG TPA: transposase [Bacillota bacterium]|nr:transposase [Bacillota bacterium]
MCPNNRRLYFTYQSNRKDKYGFKRTFKVYESEDCTDCPLRTLCTKAAEGKNRKLFYNEKWEAQKEYIRVKLSNEETGEIYGKRKIDVEPFFGFLKTNLGFTRMSVRGKSNGQNEMGFALMAVNIRKYTAINTENIPFSPEDIKMLVLIFFVINTSIFICLRLVLSQSLSFIYSVHYESSTYGGIDCQSRG